ncbi:MAG: type II secretion system protein GspM [Pseudomonadota bacterium]
MNNRLKALATRWNTLAPREQTAVAAAAIVVTLALLYWVGIAPAVATLRTSGPRQQQLDQQLRDMQLLQLRAQAAQAKPLSAGTDPAQALRDSLRPLGEAVQLAITPDGATLTLRDLSAEQLSGWLSQTRIQAHAVPVQVRLLRSDSSTPLSPGAGASGPATANAAARWSGTVVLSLPPS